MQLQTGFQSELSWKIFLDRYTMKDPQRRFQVGDLVIALVEPHPKWPKKDVGVVRSLLDDDFLSIELITGPQKGELIERRYNECDRPLETTIHDVARRIAKGVAAVERPHVQKDVEDSFAREIASLKFVPGGRIWAGAGTGQELTYFNCVAKETLIHTQDGLRRIYELSGPVSILTQGGQFRTAIFSSYGVQPLYRVTLENGDLIYATAAHEWIVTRETSDTETVTTLDLVGRRIPIQPSPKPAMDGRGIAHGLAFGASRSQAPAFAQERDTLVEYIRPYLAGVGQSSPTELLAGTPKEFFELPREEADGSYWRGFIAGLIALHGTIDSQGAVVLSELPGRVLETVREHAPSAGFILDKIELLELANHLGAGEESVSSVRFYPTTVQVQDLLLAAHRQLWSRRVDRLDTVRVVSVDATDRVEEVFCCNEPQTHTMVVGQGYLTRQCYVIPSPQDSRQGIVTTLGQMIEIMSRGGGVGINISSLRPQRTIVRGVNGRSSGAVSWMDLFSRATGLVEQGGCFAGETRIATNHGLIPAAELFERMRRGEHFSAVTHLGLKPITAQFHNGTKQLWRVTTARGLSVEVTEEHKMGVIRNGRIQTVPLKDLSIGDKILSLVGADLSDGGNCSTSYPPPSSGSAYLEERAAYRIGYAMGQQCLVPTPAAHPEQVQPSGENNRMIVAERSSLFQPSTLTPNGVAVLDGVLRADTRVMAAFIVGVFDSIGDEANREINCLSYVILHDMQLMLALMGIASHLTEACSAYRLTVPEPEDRQRLEALRESVKSGVVVSGQISRRGSRNRWADGAVYGQSTAVMVEESWSSVMPETITEVVPTRVAPVYDFEVADVHMLCGDGLYTSNSRRGALMLQIEDWHPDVWRFINVKKTPGMVENANISVRISDRFMEAVKNDGDWELVFPDTTDPEYDDLWDGNLENWRQHGKPVVHYETVKARQLWNAIIEGAWQAAEPGIVFDERHEKDSNSWYFNPLISTNPCVAGDTLIATNEGLFRAEDLYHTHRPLSVLLDERFGAGSIGSASPVFMTGIKPLVRISTREGYSVRVTPEHRIYSDERGWVAAGELNMGEAIRVRLQVGGFGSNGTVDEGRRLGNMLRSVARLCTHRPDGNLESRLVTMGIRESGPTRFGFNQAALHIAEVAWACDLKKIPAEVLAGCRDMQRGFLQTLFSTPDVGNWPRLRSTSLSLLQEVQQLLLNFGVYSRIDEVCGACAFYELTVSTRSVAQYWGQIDARYDAQVRDLGFDREDEADPVGVDEWVAHVTEVTEDGVEPVYDLTEFQTHSFSANGLVVHNCAEQPLPAWGVCTLGHINLAAFYDQDAQDVDWDGLRATIRMGTRFLDDIVDATPYFFKENFENQQRERRIGLGTMGLGELLIRLQLRYGSPESIAFIDRLYEFIATEAYLYDVELAKEKGAFPAFVPEKYLASGFMQRMPEVVRSAIREHGTRNVTILTQAPTGTVGSMVNTSTGIEPFYALTYYRQSRLGFDEQYVRVAQEWIDAHPEERLPDYFVGAMDLTPEEHVRVQAAIQRWTDSSISKTANAPSSYTIEDTAKLYELAYDLGCKGVTIYRDQSRQEQVLHLSDSAKADSDRKPDTHLLSTGVDVEVYPLPAQVNGRTYRKETPAGTARVVINEVDGSPFEVFMLLGRAGSEVQSFMEALGRIISLYLRSNGNLTARRRLELVADQLKGIGGANQMGFGAGRVLSVVDGIGKLLESHLNQGQGESLAAEPQSVRPLSTDRRTPNATYDLCPQCDAPSLIYEEGCQHCTACGYSKC